MTDFDFSAALDAAAERHARILAARDTIAELTNHTPNCAALHDPYAPDDAHSLNLDALRDMIINECNPRDLPDDIDPDPRLLPAIELIFNMRNDTARELLTEYCLDLSICPMHFDDYAACFDDDLDECAAIRAIHPSHDT